MNPDCRLKVCGIRRPVDFRAAANIGAEALGFIFYEKSPRALTFEDYFTMMRPLTFVGLRVAVDVSPDGQRTIDLNEATFDRYQFHFDTEGNYQYQVELWADVIGKDKLWLVPRLKAGEPFPVSVLPFCSAIVRDTYSPNAHGGTGQTGNWDEFRELRKQHPEVEWILAGGLTPENLGEATEVACPDWVDINSGVETAPGVKDHHKLEQLRRWIAR